VTSTPHPAGDPWPGGCPVPAAAPEGAFNFRDLGGARTVDGTQVRRGLVYRCGALDGLTCAGWDAVADLGVRTVFDLRAAHERIGQATGAVRVGVDVVQIPMWENGEPGTTLSDRVFSATGRTPEQSVAAYATAKVAAYVAMVTAYAPGFGALIEGLSAPGTLPAVMHCAAGKDRTGLAAAIVLRMLGVCEAGVLADYVRSREGISAARVDRYRHRLELSGVSLEQFAPVYAAHPPALLAALGAMTAGWGSVGGYLAGPGAVRPGVAESLRARLLAW